MILYETKCWSAKKQHVTKMNVTEMRMLSWMCGKTRNDRIKNANIRDMVGVTPIEDMLKENRFRWYGHVSRRPIDAVVREFCSLVGV